MSSTRLPVSVETFSPTMPHILSEGLWFSDYTKFKRSIINDWNTKGLRFIADMFNENTERLHTKESLENKFGIRMTFLCYASLIRSLPQHVRLESSTKPTGPII